MPDTIHTMTQAQKSSWAPETTWGVPVTTATVWFGATSFTPQPAIEVKEFAPLGVLAETVVAQQSQQVNINFEGEATYEDLQKIIQDVVTHQMADDIPSYTVGCGGITVAGAVIDSWRISGNPNEIRLSGTMVGSSFSNTPQTVNVTQLTATPVLNRHVSITIGSINILEAFSWEISVSGLWAPNRFVGSDMPGTVTQRKHDMLFKIEVEKNSNTASLLTNTNNLAVLVECGDTVSGRGFSAAFVARLRNREAFRDFDGIYGFGLEYRILNSTPAAIDITHTAP